MESFKDMTVEVKRDFSILKRQLVFLISIVTVAFSLIFYNIKFLELEKEITSLKRSKEYLLYEQLMLKKEVAKLKSPSRVHKLAVKKLKMKPVNMEKVKYIEP